MSIKTIVLVIVLVVSGRGQSIANPLDKSLKYFLGCWHIKDHKHDDKSGLTPAQLQAMVKLPVCIRKDTARLLTDTFVNNKYVIFKVSSEDYFLNVYESNKKYFEVTADSLVVLRLDGTHYSKKGRSFLVNHELFYDGSYLYLLKDQVIFRLYKAQKSRTFSWR